jgi:hypothetical protein
MINYLNFSIGYPRTLFDEDRSTSMPCHHMGVCQNHQNFHYITLLSWLHCSSKLDVTLLINIYCIRIYHRQFLLCIEDVPECSLRCCCHYRMIQNVTSIWSCWRLVGNSMRHAKVPADWAELKPSISQKSSTSTSLPSVKDTFSNITCIDTVQWR